jgi:HK97 family phage major capsid protein
VRDALEKAAVSAGGGTIWGSSFVGHSALGPAFQDALRTSSAFYKMLDDNGFIKLPFNVRLGVVTSAAIGGTVVPGQAVRVQQMAMGNTELTRRAAGCILSLSNELLAAAGSAVDALLSRSLRGSVGLAVDAEMLTVLLSGASSTAATSAPLADLSTLLTVVGLTEESKPYFLGAPDTVIRAATVDAAANGTRLFNEANVIGPSTLLGIPLLTSSAVSAGRLVLVDAAGCCAAGDAIEVDVSAETSLQMDSAPTMTASTSGAPTAVNVVSQWQVDSTAIKCIARFGIEKFRANAVATLTSVAW